MSNVKGMAEQVGSGLGREWSDEDEGEQFWDKAASAWSRASVKVLEWISEGTCWCGG